MIKTEYKYNVIYSKKFKKSLNKSLKKGKNIEKLKTAVEKLANREELEPKYRNHHLINDKHYKDCMECHIEPDWLLVYQYLDDELILLLVETGSHSEIFK